MAEFCDSSRLFLAVHTYTVVLIVSRITAASTAARCDNLAWPKRFFELLLLLNGNSDRFISDRFFLRLAKLAPSEWWEDIMSIILPRFQGKGTEAFSIPLGFIIHFVANIVNSSVVACCLKNDSPNWECYAWKTFLIKEVHFLHVGWNVSTIQFESGYFLSIKKEIASLRVL